MSEAATTSEAGGMFAPYTPPEIGELLETLQEAGQFVLLEARVREAVATQFGPRDAVDLTVQTSAPGVTRTFSGFAAGIVGQVKRANPGDLPAVVKIVNSNAGRGSTLAFELVSKPAPGADVAAIAKALPVPMLPISPSVPY